MYYYVLLVLFRTERPVDYRTDDYANERAAWNPWWAEVAWVIGAAGFVVVTVVAGLLSR